MAPPEGPLRIALVSRGFSWEEAGGGEVMVRLLAEGLARMGHDVTVVTTDARGAPKDTGVALRLVPSMGIRDLRAALREVAPDVVDVHNMEGSPGALVAARSLRLPVVVTVNSAWPVCLFADMYRPHHGVCETCSVAGVADGFRYRPPEQIGRKVPALVGYAEVRRRRFMLARATRIIAHSDASRRLLVRNDIPEGLVRVVPNFDEPAFHAPHRPEGERILYVGALTSAKGTDVLLDAFAKVAGLRPEARLQFAGTGYLRPALERRAALLRLEKRVDFLGYVPHTEVARRYQEASVVAFPVRTEEAFGRVLFEAWGAGAPLVASRISAPGDLVRHGETGLLVPPEDPDALADALVRVLQDPGLARRLAEGGRKELAKYAPDLVIPRFVDVYREALAA